MGGGGVGVFVDSCITFVYGITNHTYKTDPIPLLLFLFARLCKTINNLLFVFPGRDCLDLLHHGFNTSGLYDIDPDGKGAFQVRCDQETAGGGWVVFQRRTDGAVAFQVQNWDQYKNGFGNLSHEFWLGNDKLHRLTSMSQQLLVEIEGYAQDVAHASYERFSVQSESEKYKLTVEGYSGTAKDSLTYHNGMKFTTIDQDNDDAHNGSCGNIFPGGWWHKACYYAFLNGIYTFKNGITWRAWKNDFYKLKQTSMKIRTLRGKCTMMQNALVMTII